MHPLRRVLTSSLQQSARAAGFVNRVLQHAAVGTMPIAELRTSMDSAWDRFASNYERWAQSQGLMAWEKEWYPQSLRPDDRVLLIGCGSGRDLLGLIGLGYQVDGLEPVAGCAEAARSRIREFDMQSQVFTGAVEDFSIPAGYDTFIFSWFTYSYLPRSDSRIRVLRKLHDAAPRAGRIVISLQTQPDPPRDFYVRAARLSARVSRSGWLPERGDILGPGTQGPYRHWFSPGTLEAEARAGGWNVSWRQETPDRVTVWLLSA